MGSSFCSICSKNGDVDLHDKRPLSFDRPKHRGYNSEQRVDEKVRGRTLERKSMKVQGNYFSFTNRMKTPLLKENEHDMEEKREFCVENIKKAELNLEENGAVTKDGKKSEDGNVNAAPEGGTGNFKKDSGERGKSEENGTKEEVKGSDEGKQVCEKIEKIKKIPKIVKKKEVSECEDQNIQNTPPPAFFSYWEKLPQLCLKHFLDPNYVMIVNKEYRPNGTKSKFFKANLLLSLTKHKDFINAYLRRCINENTDLLKLNLVEFEESFFDISFHSLTSFNIVGFNSKEYYLKPKVNKSKMELFILCSSYPIDNKYVGIKLIENGKLYGGVFDKNGEINNGGIYIDKKGNLFSGTYVNSTMSSASVSQLNDAYYESSVKNMKKDGIKQTESTQNYEFKGDFEQGKKVAGVYITKQLSSKSSLVKSVGQGQTCIKDIEIDKEMFKHIKATLGSDSFDLTAKYSIESKLSDAVIYGRVCNQAFNGKKFTIFQNMIKKYPCYIGDVVNNKMCGNGEYYWSADEYYKGHFYNNQFSNIDEDTENQNTTRILEQPGTLKALDQNFKVDFTQGKVVSFQIL